jgi:TRAP-type C4-dicarboxylate transport system permease small subunit
MTQPVRIPADVDREDRLVANLTARQVLILTVTGLLLYGAWTVTRPVLPTAVFLLFALPVAATAAALALGSRDGVGLDRLLAAAVRQRLQPTATGLPPPTASVRHLRG